MTHRRGERHRVERLGDDARGAKPLELLDFARLGAGGHEHDRDRRRAAVLAQLREGHRPIHDRHHDVEQNEVGPPRKRGRERLVAGGATAQHEQRIERERHIDDFPNIGLVVREHDMKIDHATSLFEP